MKWLISLWITIFFVPVLYGQATLDDVETLKKLGYDEEKILQQIKELGGFPDVQKHYVRLRRQGFSAALLKKIMELTAKPKLPPLPDKLQKLAKRSGINKAAKDIWVLAIGVNSYLHSTSFPKLQYAVADAEGFARHMVSLGVPADQICLLTDREVTASNIEQTLREITGAKGEIYMFYAGHGLYVDDIGFLFACHNADPEKIRDTTFPMSRLKKFLAGMKQQRALVFLDACHSGGARGAVVEFAEDEEEGADTSVAVGALDKAAQSEIKDMNSVGEKQVAIITSCRENQLSKEGKGHGLFTQNLLAGLSGKADQDRDGRILSKELFFFLNRELPVQSDLEQMPDYNYSPTWEEGKGLPASRFGSGDSQWNQPQQDGGSMEDYEPVVKKPQNDRYEPNDSRQQAREVAAGRYAGLQIIAGEEDWYSFYLTRPSDLQAVVGFAHGEGDLDIALYDGKGVLSRAESKTDHEAVYLKNLMPGRYWLLVKGYNKATNVYDLELHLRERVTFKLTEVAPVDAKGRPKSKFQMGEKIHLKVAWNVESLPANVHIYEWLEVKGEGIAPYKRKFRSPAIRGNRHLVLPIELKKQESQEYSLDIEMRVGEVWAQKSCSFVLEAYGLPQEVWQACSYRHKDKLILDMTTDYWKKLSAEQQRRYASEYQQGYARALGLKTEKTFYLGGAPFVMRFIPPGRFLQGSPPGGSHRREELQHPVVISRPFWLQKTEFTQEQCKQVTGKMPWRGKREAESNPRYPAIYISWTDIEKRILPHLKELALPTEAQWEYACRAGTTTPFYWGDSIAEMGKYANVYDKSADRSQDDYYYPGDDYHYVKTTDSYKKMAAVGSLKANAFGLHDISGNVWEWCQDWADLYTKEEQVDPTGPSSGKKKILRGGSWKDGKAADIRSARRDLEEPGHRSSKAGFRFCMKVK